MSSTLIRSAAAAVVAAILLPAASFAQSGDRTSPTFQNAGSQVCSQLEIAAGIPSEDCGKLTLSEIALIKSKRDNTN